MVNETLRESKKKYNSFLLYFNFINKLPTKRFNYMHKVIYYSLLLNNYHLRLKQYVGTTLTIILIVTVSLVIDWTFCEQNLGFVTSKTSRPVAHAPNWVKTQIFRTSVLPTDDSVRVHFSAVNELFAGQRMGKIALVQALNHSVIVYEYFAVRRNFTCVIPLLLFQPLFFG